MNWQECTQQNIMLNAHRALKEAKAAGDETWMAQILHSTPGLLEFVGGHGQIVLEKPKPAGQQKEQAVQP